MSLTVEVAQYRLTRLGIMDVEHIASGMEGHVFQIGDQNVAKVWLYKHIRGIVPLKHFYEQLQTLGLPFETPLISQVKEVDGTAISIERKLRGTSMRELVTEDEREPPAFALKAVLTVLGALKGKSLSSGESYLPVLGIMPSQEATFGGPTLVLLEVAGRKVEKYGHQLRRSVPNFN